MGKTQSKRSVDITTEPKKGTEEEVTEKLEKIEDLDQKQLNGDATPQETNDAAEKKDSDETENDKDLTTEKGAEITPAIAENGDHNNTSVASTEETPKDDTTATKEGAATEEITPLADESIKKSKKEKVKKKWSFRSISFGRKDKQKQTKNDETVETAATNGEADKTEENPEAPKTDDGAGDGDTKLKDKHENGNASEKELNGEKTPTPTEEEPIKEIDNENKTTTAAKSTGTVPATKNETAIEHQTDNKAALSSETIEEAAAILNAALASNNHVETETNGIEASVVKVNVVKETETSTAAITEVSVGIESIKTIPCVLNDEKPHQNGTTEDDEEPEAVAAKLNKSQIEVNINIDNDNETATTLDSSPIPTEALEIKDNKSCTEVEAGIVQVSAGVSGDKMLEESKTGETAEPPPLPISSPPSQVSVFVLNTNAGSEELPANESVEVVKTVLESIAMDHETRIVPNEHPSGGNIPITVDNIQKDINVDIASEQEVITVATVPFEQIKDGVNDVSEPTATGPKTAQVEHENSGENETMHFTSAANIQLQPLAVPSSEETSPNIEASETILCAVLTESEQTSGSANEDLLAVSQVVDDVTKKAIEIIEAEFALPVEYSDKHANEVTDDNDNGKTEQTDPELQEQKPKEEEEKAENSTDPQDIGTTLFQKQNVLEDCLNEQQVQSKTLNNDDDKELSLPQDNAIATEVTAAEITTQDLAVTCE